jgi:hypothetical protein
MKPTTQSFKKFIFSDWLKRVLYATSAMLIIWGCDWVFNWVFIK